MTEIPADILFAIQTSSKVEWPDDSHMQDYYIQSETNGYFAVQEMNFGDALPFKDQIIGWASDIFDEWEDRATFVEEEIESYVVLHNRPDDIPVDVFCGLKFKASAMAEYFSSQIDTVQEGIRHFRYVRDTRARVGPIRNLLLRMEGIIGDECYNDNIQNYSSWGVWDGEGRSFRYPVTVLRNGETEKRRTRLDDLQPEELVTGHYKFGANELSIYRALVKIIDMLETEYGFEVPPT